FWSRWITGASITTHEFYVARELACKSRTHQMQQRSQSQLRLQRPPPLRVRSCALRSAKGLRFRAWDCEHKLKQLPSSLGDQQLRWCRKREIPRQKPPLAAVHFLLSA